MHMTSLESPVRAMRTRTVGRQIDYLAMAHAALGNHVIGKLLHVSAASLEYGDFEAALVIKVYVQSCLREIMMFVVIAREALRQLAFLVIVDIEKCSDARLSVGVLTRARCKPERDRSRIASERLA